MVQRSKRDARIESNAPDHFISPSRSYLLKADGKVIERPQHMIMRVAVGIHKDDVDAAIETYDLMSQRLFTHATPTLFNAGTPKPQMSSCFLLTMKEDSISGIYDTLKQVGRVLHVVWGGVQGITRFREEHRAC